MLKKLRIKFIVLNMATVAVVLAVIFSAICVINYQQSVASVHEAMSNAIAFTESKSRALTDGDTQGQEGAREQDAGDPDEQSKNSTTPPNSQGQTATAAAPRQSPVTPSLHTRAKGDAVYGASSGAGPAWRSISSSGSRSSRQSQRMAESP